MDQPIFYIVDVFAQSKYTGNPLAVVTNAEEFSSDKMQEIAQEMNYSETTFITSSQKHSGGYDVRIFTPKEELPFAGHPTLGTAYVLQTEIQKQFTKEICLNLKVGQIQVTWETTSEGREILWMRQNSPVFSQQFSASVLAEILNIEVDSIDSRFPIQEVSTGIPFIIVPLKTLADLKACKVNLEKYYQLIQDTNAKAILVFSPEGYLSESELSVRMFADALGIPEDPATGSANGCLAGYLAKYQYFGKPELDIQVDQGYEINRPSILFLKASQGGDNISVQVGGQVVMVAKGELF